MWVSAVRAPPPPPPCCFAVEGGSPVPCSVLPLVQTVQEGRKEDPLLKINLLAFLKSNSVFREKPTKPEVRKATGILEQRVYAE